MDKYPLHRRTKARCNGIGKKMRYGGIGTFLVPRSKGKEGEGEMSKYKQKYQKGEPITSIDELMTQDFVYFYDKITNRGWFGSWQLRLARSYIQRGCLYYAERIDENEN